jgi:TolA-binding protein
MAAKDAQAREKAQEVEKRVTPLVGRTGTLESQVASLQSQVASLNSQVASLNAAVAAINSRLGTTNFAGLRAVDFTGYNGGSPAAYTGVGGGAYWLTKVNSQLNAVIGALG